MRYLNRAFLSIAAVSLLAVAARPASAANLIQNGGFETGDFTNWTTPVTLPEFYLVAAADSTNGLPPGPLANGYYVHTGTYAAQLGTETPSTLSQTFAGVAGQSYVLSFWLNGDFSGSASSFDASIDGVMMNLIDPAFGWHQETLTFTGAASNTLTFTFVDANGVFLSLDDVSVTSATPEPSTLLLLGTGICALTAMTRRRLFNA